jgi:hypothetical protein
MLKLQLIICAGVVLLFCATKSAMAQVSACLFSISDPARGAISDGLLLHRYANNVSGDAAFVGGTGIAANAAASLRNNIQALTARLDIDGDGQITAYDSQVAARVRLGYTTAWAIAGLTPSAQGIRNTPALAQAFLNAGCPGPTGAPVALNVRVQGLTMGGTVRLGHGSATLDVTFNNQPYAFAPQLPAGAPRDLRIVSQLAGQTCAVSEIAPTTVPVDGAPIFVRCRHTSATRVTMPVTLPNADLSMSFGVRDVAYPGVPYESRPGVVGGLFPYQYELKTVTLNGNAQNLNAVALDLRQGTLRFTPATEGTYAITIEVRDSSA